MSGNVSVLRPAAPSPVVATLPHGGRDYPDPFSRDLIVPIDSLWSDWYTAELYDFLPSLGVTTIVNNLSRFVADPNRRPHGELHGHFNTSMVAFTDPRGRQLYAEPLAPDNLQQRVQLGFDPFHAALSQTVAELLSTHGRLLLLDLHCFSRPIDADVIIGDRHGATAREPTVALVESALGRGGLSTVRNVRFSGGWIVERFQHSPNVDAIQLELNCRVYLQVDPDGLRPRREPAMWDAGRAAVMTAFENIVAAFDGTG